MKSSFILLKIKKNNILEVEQYLINNNIYFNNLTKKDNYIILKISFEDYLKIKKYYGKKVKLLKYIGIQGIKKHLKKTYIFFLSIIFSLIVIYVLSNTIFDVKILSNNKNLIETVEEELKTYGIEKYKFIKSYDEIEKIKKEILLNNNELLEWIEINRKGTKYVVNLTERIKNEEKKENSLRHIVAATDALILKVVNRKGMIVKNVNDYVHKGEIIVSGDVYRGEETIVNSVEADADVYGEVWYTVNVTIPLEYTEYSSTGKVVNHYYLKFPNFDMTLLGYYKEKNVISEKEILLDKPYLFFKLIKETKTIYKYEKFNLTEKEALNEAIKRATKSMNTGLKADEYIISKKVLKNSSFSSKINVEIFFRVYKNIKEYSFIANNSESE